MKGLLKRNKKTFIFMTSLLLFLIGAGVIQEIVKNLKPFEDVPVVSVETKDENKNQGSEILKKPVNDDVKVSKGFYDTSLDDKKLEEALVYFEGVYRPNLMMGLIIQRIMKALMFMRVQVGLLLEKKMILY